MFHRIIKRVDFTEAYAQAVIFLVGKPNDAYAKYFVGQSYLAPILAEGVLVVNVTFEPGCRNNWHIHKAIKGGGQTLTCVDGRGYYKEWGKEPIELRPGDAVYISTGRNIGTGWFLIAGSRISP